MKDPERKSSSVELEMPYKLLYMCTEHAQNIYMLKLYKLRMFAGIKVDNKSISVSFSDL